MISEDSVTSTAERRRERVAGSEKKVSQEGGSRGRVDRGGRFAGLMMVTHLTNLINQRKRGTPSLRPNGRIS